MRARTADSIRLRRRAPAERPTSAVRPRHCDSRRHARSFTPPGDTNRDPRRKRSPRSESTCIHALAACRLHGQYPQGATTARHDERSSARTGWFPVEVPARPSSGFGPPDLQRRAVQRSERPRRRIERADLPVDRVRVSRPVDPRVGAADLRRIAHALLGLGRRHEAAIAAKPIEHVDDRRCAELRELVVQRPCGLARRDGNARGRRRSARCPGPRPSA